MNKWPLKRIEDISDKSVKYPVGDGDHGQIKPSVYKKEGVPYIRVNDIRNGTVSLKELVYISEETHKDNPKSELFPDDVIIAKTGATIGRAAIIPSNIKKANTTSSVGKITVDKNIILPKYLLYYINTFTFQDNMWKVSHKSAQPGFNIIDLKNFLVPVPPLPIQKQIVSILERAEKMKQKRQKVNEETNEIIQSVFYELFGDPAKNEKGFIKARIGDCCQVKGGKRLLKGARFSDNKTNRPYLRVTDMRNQTIVDDDIKYMSDEIFQKIKRYTISSDNVYITIAGSIGLVGTIPNKYDGASLTENAAKFIFDNRKINKIFLTQMLSTDYCQKQIEIHTHAVGVPKLALFRIEKIELLVPPIRRQNEFAEIVKKIELLKEKQKQSTEGINILFDALMQKAFNGGLVS